MLTRTTFSCSSSILWQCHRSSIWGRKLWLIADQKLQQPDAPTFEPKVFTELRNAQSIVLAYDGLNPLPPTYCYLKPHYLDKDRTYFEQLAKNMNIPAVGTAEAAWSRIIPFLRPIEPLIRDPEISDIMINGERGVFFEKHGRLERLPDVTIPEKSLQVAARNIARLPLVGEVRGSEGFDLLQAMDTEETAPAPASQGRRCPGCYPQGRTVGG